MTANSLIINDLDNQGELPEPGKAEGGTGERGRKRRKGGRGVFDDYMENHVWLLLTHVNYDHEI